MHLLLVKVTDAFIFKNGVDCGSGQIVAKMLPSSNHLLVLYYLLLLHYSVCAFEPHFPSIHRPVRRKEIRAERRVIGGSAVPRGTRPYMVNQFRLLLIQLVFKKLTFY